MDTDDEVDLDWVWGRAPIGVTIYEPILRDGVLVDMRLVFVNDAVSSRAGLRPNQMYGWSVSRVIGDELWQSLLVKYQQMLKDGQPITYGRTYDQPEVGGRFSYVVTAWYAAPWVGVMVKEASNDEVGQLDEESIRAALDIVEKRSVETLKLAQLLNHQRPSSD